MADDGHSRSLEIHVRVLARLLQIFRTKRVADGLHKLLPPDPSVAEF